MRSWYWWHVIFVSDQLRLSTWHRQWRSSRQQKERRVLYVESCGFTSRYRCLPCGWANVGTAFRIRRRTLWPTSFSCSLFSKHSVTRHYIQSDCKLNTCWHMAVSLERNASQYIVACYCSMGRLWRNAVYEEWSATTFSALCSSVVSQHFVSSVDWAWRTKKTASVWFIFIGLGQRGSLPLENKHIWLAGTKKIRDT